MVAAQRRARTERQHHPEEEPGRAHRDAGRPGADGEHTHHAGDGVEHQRLRHSDHQLTGQRPAEAVTTEPDDAAEGGEHHT